MELNPSVAVLISYLKNSLDLDLLFACLPRYIIEPDEYKMGGRKLKICNQIKSGSIFNLHYKGQTRGPIASGFLNCISIRMVYHSLPFTLALAAENVHVNTGCINLVNNLLQEFIKIINQIIIQLKTVKKNVKSELITRTINWLLKSTKGEFKYDRDVTCTMRKPLTIPDGLDPYLAAFGLEQISYHDDWFMFNQMLTLVCNYLRSDLELKTTKIIKTYESMVRYNYRLDRTIELEKLAVLADRQQKFYCHYDNTQDKRVTLFLKVAPADCPTPFKRDIKVVKHTISIGAGGDVRQTSPNIELAAQAYDAFQDLMREIMAGC